MLSSGYAFVYSFLGARETLLVCLFSLSALYQPQLRPSQGARASLTQCVNVSQLRSHHTTYREIVVDIQVFNRVHLIAFRKLFVGRDKPLTNANSPLATSLLSADISIYIYVRSRLIF